METINCLIEALKDSFHYFTSNDTLCIIGQIMFWAFIICLIAVCFQGLIAIITYIGIKISNYIHYREIAEYAEERFSTMDIDAEVEKIREQDAKKNKKDNNDNIISSSLESNNIQKL